VNVLFIWEFLGLTFQCVFSCDRSTEALAWQFWPCPVHFSAKYRQKGYFPSLTPCFRCNPVHQILGKSIWIPENTIKNNALGDIFQSTAEKVQHFSMSRIVSSCRTRRHIERSIRCQSQKLPIIEIVWYSGDRNLLIVLNFYGAN